MNYTARFSEEAVLLGKISPASYGSEQNSGYVSLANCYRAVVVINAGVLGQDVDVDLEQAKDTSGTGAKALDSGSKDITLTATADNNTVSVIEIRGEELDVSNKYKAINLEMTPSGSSAIFGAEIWGFVSRYAPVSTAGLDSVTD